MTDNPLKKYFRRPALYLKIPSGGKGYPEGSIDMPENKELPVYPMTAADELTSRTPDALFNGIAVTEIIKSCVPNIKDPWAILQSDLDSILIAIKIASTGNNMEIDIDCPSCKEENKFDISLPGLLGTFKYGNYEKTTTTTDGLTIKFKPLNYKMLNESGLKQFELQKALSTLSEESTDSNEKTKQLISELHESTKLLIANTIEYIKTPEATVMDKTFILELLDNCDIKTFNFIRDSFLEIKKSSEVEPLKMTCVHCKHDFSTPFNINVTDFFD
jgi:hypothetical protein